MSQCPCARIVEKPLSEFNTKYSGGIDCFSIHADPCIVVMKSSIKVPLIQSDIYENSKHPLVNKDSCEKFCASVLFNDVTFVTAIFLTVDQL